MSSKVERLQGGTPYRRRHDWHRPGPNPPVLQDTGTEAIETLGELMLFDKNMSPGRNQACASCHMPYAGFSGPIPSVNLTMIAYPGTVHFRAGKRTAQRHTYAPFFPVLQYNQEQVLFFGGNFWDSRATGYRLRNPDAEQAQGPPVDTQEMGFPDTACVAFRLSQAVYRPLFEVVWGEGSLRYQLPARHREDLRNPWRGCGVRREHHASSAEPGRPHQRQTRSMTTGARLLTHTSSPCRSALSRRNSTLSWRANTR